MICEETAELVFSRLRLAQQLLEESDGLSGRDGYDLHGKKWWFHPRHEREALVVYLLLTCFDKLGQKQSFMTFHNWLKSRKSAHATERENIASSIPEALGVVESSAQFFEHYQALYGVRNAFYEGVSGLPDGAKNQLLGSVRLSFNPEFGMHGPNVSTPSKPIEDSGLEFDLKLKYLYGKRNKFTHKLDQYHSCSVPAMSEFGLGHGSSWGAMIRQRRIIYLGSHQEYEKVSSGGAYVYIINNWPFVLFEVLYAALGIDFDRTSIRLKFQVMVYSTDESVVTTYNHVDHKHLKDCDTFLKMTGAF
ncbi:hypothetical protein LP43_1999 [Methylophaga thiooxydans]|uniref:Uncharacterized protein n=1 Tax=Methylophaga thiooxydans TaxID=392484 RepID=A0A0A0BDU1_9GAMM|nr:hypothetical protein [Methylophaga thiooxydans]KGM06126.1 hypothetical protein LP43_1999 [Methylophaga thiooxydans]